MPSSKRKTPSRDRNLESVKRARVSDLAVSGLETTDKPGTIDPVQQAMLDSLLPSKEKLLASIDIIDEEIDHAESKIAEERKTLKILQEILKEDLKLNPNISLDSLKAESDDFGKENKVLQLSKKEMLQAKQRVADYRKEEKAKIDSLFKSIKEKNRALAEASHKEVPVPACMESRGQSFGFEKKKGKRRVLLPLYQRPQDAPSWKLNEKLYLENRKRFLIAMRRRQEALEEREEKLAQEYMVKRENWQKEIKTFEEGREESIREAVGPETFYKPTPGGSSGDSGELKNAINLTSPKPNAQLSLHGSVPGSSSVGLQTPPVPSSSVRTPASRGVSRSDMIRSEYEQQQLLEQMLAEEARQNKYKLTLAEIPDMIIDERERNFETFLKNGNSRYQTDAAVGSMKCFGCALRAPCPKDCNCPVQQEINQQQSNPWADIEKAIFIDKFLQHPKQFGMISKFLINKSTKDCVAFYYKSKTKIPYKELLREQQHRRKAHSSSRMEQANSWTLIMKALQSIGIDVNLADFDQEGYLRVRDRMIRRDEKILMRKRRRQEKKRRKKKELLRAKKKEKAAMKQKERLRKKKEEEEGMKASLADGDVKDTNEEQKEENSTGVQQREGTGLSVTTKKMVETVEQNSKQKKKKKKTKKKKVVASVVGMDIFRHTTTSDFFIDEISGFMYDIDRFEGNLNPSESESGDDSTASTSESSSDEEESSDGADYYAGAYSCDFKSAMQRSKSKTRTLAQIGIDANDMTPIDYCRYPSAN
eukprot:g4851.t1